MNYELTGASPRHRSADSVSDKVELPLPLRPPASLAARRSSRVATMKPNLADVAVREALQLLHLTTSRRVELSRSNLVSGLLHIAQVTNSLMYLRSKASA